MTSYWGDNKQTFGLYVAAISYMPCVYCYVDHIYAHTRLKQFSPFSPNRLMFSSFPLWKMDRWKRSRESQSDTGRVRDIKSGGGRVGVLFCVICPETSHEHKREAVCLKFHLASDYNIRSCGLCANHSNHPMKILLRCPNWKSIVRYDKLH